MSRLKSLFLSLLFVVSCPALSHAVWIWTPETGKFINPKWSVKSTPREQLEFAMTFFEVKKYPQAMMEFKKLLKNYPRAKEAPEAQYYIGQILEEMHKPYDAYKAYQMVIDKYPFSELAGKIVEIEYNIADSMMQGKDRRGRFMEVIAGGGDWIPEIFRTVIKNAPYGKYAAVSQYKIGLYLKGRGLYEDARDAFEKTMDDYPNSEWAQAAKFQIAVADTKRSGDAQHEQKVTSVALEEFKEYVRSHPESDLTPQAQEQIIRLREKEAESIFDIGKFYEKQKNFKSAAVYYKDVVKRYSDTAWAPQATGRLKTIGE